jgi:asparagine synthase (glutamine-hydrolysing)
MEPDRTPLIALSGGIDSRLVAGGLARCGAPAVGMTHLDDHGSEAADASTAAQVAERLGMPWELVRMRPPTGEQLAVLLKLKFGANYLGMSRVLPFLDHAVACHGRAVTCFTGDQGDRVLGPITPLAPLADDVAVARYVLRREAIFSPEAVGAAIAIRPSDLFDALVARIRSYPERQPARKYVHFLFQERALRWAFEGEDRNRCWFWSVTPFFAPDVFETAMALPPSAKAFHRLRVAALAAIAPELVRIPDATTRGRLTSPVFRMQHTLRTMARRTMFRAFDGDTERRLIGLLRRVDGYDPRSPAVRLVREQLATGPAGTFFRPEGMERILGRARSIAREQFSVMFTVTSLVEALEGGGTALAHFADTLFV